MSTNKNSQIDYVNHDNHIGVGYGYNANSTYKKYYTQNFAKY
jgi:hypothetical protein